MENSYSDFCPLEISLQECDSEEISHHGFYSDLVYKLPKVKGTANFISSSSKILIRLKIRRRKYEKEEEI